MNINQNLTKSDINKNDLELLEHETQLQGTRRSGWIFDKINSMKIRYYKTAELNRSSYNIKKPLRSSALINIRNNDKYCFLWPFLQNLHPCENDHPNRISNSEQYIKGLINEIFDFTNGFRCSDVHIFEKLKKLPNKIIQLNFYQNKNNRKHNLTPFEICKSVSDRVVDLLIYKNQYSLNEKLNVFFRKS